MQPVPKTYGDWVSLIGDEADSSCDAERARALCAGRFEPSAAERVFALVQAFCTRCLNRQTTQVLARLKELDAADADGFALVCRRYAKACERLLFFRELEQLPQGKTRALEQEMKRYVANVLREVGRSVESDAAAYMLARLERQWLNRE